MQARAHPGSRTQLDQSDESILAHPGRTDEQPPSGRMVGKMQADEKECFLGKLSRLPQLLRTDGLCMSRQPPWPFALGMDELYNQPKGVGPARLEPEPEGRRGWGNPRKVPSSYQTHTRAPHTEPTKDQKSKVLLAAEMTHGHRAGHGQCCPWLLVPHYLIYCTLLSTM
jgi:hypothetical protein